PCKSINLDGDDVKGINNKAHSSDLLMKEYQE
ncbi:hypothetical protein MEE_01590, partial [Bartonella elizabethae F9251 = ATCC 49927]